MVDIISTSAENQLLSLPGVTSVGRGLVEGGDGVIVGVASPGDVSSVESRIASQFGQSIQGVPYDVRVTGQFVPQSSRQNDRLSIGTEPRAAEDPQRQSRFRPIPMGVSIGHIDITAGTSGFLLTDGTSIYEGSNNHVLANSNDGNPGDSIIQPGSFDGGTIADKVGELEDYVTVENGVTVDMAWARPAGAEFELSPEGLGELESQVVSPQPGEQMIKTGRTTGVTTGVVEQVEATTSVSFGGDLGIVRMEDQIVTTNMSSPGDSGSAAFIRRDGTLRPAGALFAGSSSTTVFNAASNWESESGMTILPRGPAQAGPDNLLIGVGIVGGLGGAVLHDALDR